MSLGLKSAPWSFLLGCLTACQIELLRTEPDDEEAVAAATTGAGTNGGAGAPGSGGGAGAPNNVTTTGEPVFEGDWVAAVGDLEDHEFDCFVDYMSELPNGGPLIAGIGRGGLFTSDDGGETWELLGTSAEVIANGPTSIVFDPDDADVFWEAGIYGDSPYKTEDGGETFVRLGEIAHTDHVSIDFTDPDRQTLLAGTHENRDFFHLSINGGADWENIASRIPDECVHLTSPHILDAETFLLGCLRGIARSDDAGETWTLVSEIGGTAPPLIAHDGTIYWRIEGGGLVRSEDDGKTWSRLSLPTPADLPHVSPPVELPDDRLALLANDIILISDDRGETWEQVTPALPSLPNVPKGYLYSRSNRAFYVWTHTCEIGAVGGDEIQRYDFDYEND